MRFGTAFAVGLGALVSTGAGAAPKPAAAPSPSRSPRAPAPTGRSVALLGISGGVGMNPKVLSSLEEVILAALSSGQGVARVVGRSDIASVLGWEEKKQKLGCEESTACIAEVAGALGVDVIAAADVSKVGSYVLLSFKLIDARAGTVLVRITRKTASEDALVDALDPVVAEALAKAFPQTAQKPSARPDEVSAPAAVAAAEPKPEQGSGARSEQAGSAIAASSESREVPAAALQPAPAPLPRSRIAAWSLLGAAVVAAAAGGYFVSDAWSSTGAMATATDEAAFSKAKSGAESATTGANVSFAVAGTALVAGVAVWWFAGRAPTE